MYASRGLPIVCVGQEHAGAVDMVNGCAGVLECGGYEGEALLGLLRDVAVVCTNGTGARDVNVIANAYDIQAYTDSTGHMSLLFKGVKPTQQATLVFMRESYKTEEQTTRLIPPQVVLAPVRLHKLP